MNHEHNEWRISFSLAEYKIVKSMNHSQFLVYGLLKIFLKEVINQQYDKSKICLCSYYMKTVVYWTIQQNSNFEWCPENLLKGFWMCFKLLLKWVYEGVCPNFFIPQNNMFLGKICGAAQRNLFRQLYSLYKKGLDCLLLSTSYRHNVSNVVNNPGVEMSLKMEIDYEAALCSEIDVHDAPVPMEDLHRCMETLQITEKLIGSQMTQNQTAMFQKYAATAIQWIAFMLPNTIKSNEDFDIPCHLLRVAVKLGFDSDIAYIAMYYYRTKRYSEALCIINKMKNMVRETQIDRSNNVYVYKKRCNKTSSGKRLWSTKMMQDIKLCNTTFFIEELLPEQLSGKRCIEWTTDIPLLVGIHFLEFLCNRHIDTEQAEAALDELKKLVHNHKDVYIINELRDISWQILGICQQMTGDFEAAKYSYKQSTKQYQYHQIQYATHKRIQDMNMS